MSTVFADTGYWYASLNPRDSLHQSALATLASVAPSRIVTTQMILVELLALVASEGPAERRAAVALVRRLEEDESVEVIPQTSEQFQRALEMYAAREDKSWEPHRLCIISTDVRAQDFSIACTRQPF